MKAKILATAFLLSSAWSLWSLPAAADTSLELLHGWNYNDDFNGKTERTVLTIKTFQPFAYGSFFMFYDITGPFAAPDANVTPNEKGGFFGSMSLNLSIKKIGEKLTGSKWDWGPLLDLSVHYELETVSKFGSLHYYGLQQDLKVPGFDFVSMLAVIRDDWSLKGAALQLGGAWQVTIPIWKITDLVFAGFYSWGVTAEGKGKFTAGNGPEDNATIPQKGNTFFLTQPQLMLDIGKLSTVVEHKFYAGIEYQFAFNRYLIPGKTENVAQLLFKWQI